jgi:fatty acid desaturase
MRNLTAEKKFTDRLLALAGLMVLIGLVALLIGTQMWIVENTIGPMFWVLEGIWAVIAGIIFATLAQISQAGQQHTKPLDSSALK